MEQVETNNQVEYTQEEKDLAARHKVEPKLIRLLNEIIEERLRRLNECIEQLQFLNKNIDGRLAAPKQTAAEPEPEEPVTQEQPEQEQPAALSIDEQTQERLKSFYKNLDPRTKLAIVTLSEIHCLDGINFQSRLKEGRLIDEIWDDLQSVCLETFHKESDDVIEVAVGVIDQEDIWLCGVWESISMVIQNC